MKLISFDKIKKAKPKKKAKTIQDQLTKLWFEVQKKKRRNTILKDEMSRMINVYQKYIEQQSEQRFQSLYNFIERLIFLGKEAKFTSKQHEIYQRMLQYYLVEGLHSPFSQTLKFDKLIPDFQIVSENSTSKNTKTQKKKERNEYVKKQLQLLSKFEDVESFFSCDEWELMLKDDTQIKSLFEKKIAPILLKRQNEKLQSKAKEQFKVREKTQINFTSVHSLYKKLAKKFHPDLVIDENQKEERHRLMSVITEAKNKEDITTLLDLYSLHFSEEEIKFKIEESEKLLQLFEKQLIELEEEKDKIIGGPKEHYIYQLFIGKSGSGIDREVEKIVHSEKTKYKHFTTLKNELISPEHLKNLLQEYL